MFSLAAFKVAHPSHVFLNRGNHEAQMANTFYGFFGELATKYEAKMCELFTEIFKATPLCHVINNEVFVVHGGIPGPDPRVWWKGIDNQISFDGRQIQISLDEIENSDRFMEPNPAENPLMVDLLWSDPKGKDGYGPSGRMSSGIYLFGPDISRNFMEYNNLRMTLRSHEVKSEGYRCDHAGVGDKFKLVTIFSAPNYVDKAGNKAAVAVLTNTGGNQLAGPEYIQYEAQPHPDVPSGAYAVGGPLHPDTLNPQAVAAAAFTGESVTKAEFHTRMSARGGGEYDVSDTDIENFYAETISGSGGMPPRKGLIEECVVKFFLGEFIEKPDGTMDFQRASKYTGPAGMVGPKDAKGAVEKLVEQIKLGKYVCKAGGGPGADDTQKVMDDGKGWVWLAADMTPGGLFIALYKSIPFGKRPLLVAKQNNVDEMVSKINWQTVLDRVEITMGGPQIKQR
jgi:diadenosine tetraphosphatase ApaH/serine/threonine PP2A family protein phosphatase